MNERKLTSEHSASQENQESVTSIHSSRRRFLRAAAAMSVGGEPAMQAVLVSLSRLREMRKFLAAMIDEFWMKSLDES